MTERSRGAPDPAESSNPGAARASGGRADLEAVRRTDAAFEALAARRAIGSDPALRLLWALISDVDEIAKRPDEAVKRPDEAAAKCSDEAAAKRSDEAAAKRSDEAAAKRPDEVAAPAPGAARRRAPRTTMTLGRSGGRRHAPPLGRDPQARSGAR